ncbi:MAG TPA: protein phosphatase 2C domain-containing protein [Roseateles sp.]|nr:protein phosphatase 2C domain-containing protein [Roseateles sp.]HWT53188.1 protein phosphatase 2C domain-containing protein [Rhodocyclaceae bacterium]
MKFTIYQESRIGTRQVNQDRVAYCYSRDALLLIVADGMGGHAHGEIAAQIATNHISTLFQREARPHLPDPMFFLSVAIEGAHAEIVAEAQRQAMPENPRTTCVVCVVQNNVAYWAHVGDSRLYLVRDGKPLAQTRDHSLVQTLVDSGSITAEQARSHPARNRIFSCLGGTQEPQIDFSRKTPMQDGDILVLCTDGVWGPLEEDLCQQIAYSNVLNSVPLLLDEAERRAGRSSDNLSIIAINWQEDEEEELICYSDMPTMPMDVYTVPPEGGMHNANALLSDNEIEEAIEEIRQSIKLNTPIRN